MAKYKLLFLYISCICCVPWGNIHAAQRHIVRRAAFDIGSSQIRVQVADVDTVTNRVACTLFSQVVNVELREDIAKSLNGKLSNTIQNKTVQVITELMKEVFTFQPCECTATATETLRIAKNSNELLEHIRRETGLSVEIISQEEEGVLGFITAVHEAKADPDTAVCLDIGGGSFQVTTTSPHGYCTISKKFGEVVVKNMLLRVQGKERHTFSPNPVSKQEAFQVIDQIKKSIQLIPSSFEEKLSRQDTTTLIIGVHPLWKLEPQSATFDIHRISRELESRLNLDDKAIQTTDVLANACLEKWPAFAWVVTDLILAYSVMKRFGMHHAQFVETAGNTTGLLLSPKYWVQ